MTSDDAHPPSAAEEARFASQLELDELSRMMREGLDIRDRKYRFRTYRKCFVGTEACQWLVAAEIASDYEQAVLIGNMLLRRGVFHHVVKEHDFKNEYLFYRFADDEDHGKASRRKDGSVVSWLDFIRPGWDLTENRKNSLVATIPTYENELEQMGTFDTHGVEPLDAHNAALLDHVHPREWRNPEPKGVYNMVVVGAGVGGLVTAAAAAGLGARVALIEENLMGGDCLNVGCVPSKALLRAARAAAAVRSAARYGVRIKGVPGDGEPAVEVDFAAVMERMRRVRAHISKHDSAQRFARDLGVDVYIGRGSFTSKNSLEVAGKTLRFARCCIATGGTPAIPAVPGLAEAPIHTNLNLFNLTVLPPRLGVIGTGAVGIEMAQAFQRLGARVTVFGRSPRILRREDEDAAELVQRSLERDGVEFILTANYREVTHEPAPGGGDFPRIRVVLEDGAREFDALLVATGRKPNVAGMNLEGAGVDYDPGRGVIVNDRLQTSNPNIYAVGDVASRYQFTHVADFMARLVVRNALFFGRDRFSNFIIPWCTYTQPEIAHVGLYARDLDARAIPYKTFTRHFSAVDRALVDGSAEGFVRIHVKHGSDEILGASIVGDGAGDMISELTLAMHTGAGLGKLASVIHPYPTRAEAIRQTGDLYNRTRLTKTVKKILRHLMSLQR